MKAIILFLCTSLFGIEVVTAQSLAADLWQEKPQLHTVPADMARESAVIISETTALQYEDGADGNLWMHRTVHRIIKVLDDQGIESFNKMTVPVYAGQELEMLKARTILPGGKIIDVSKDKMKESKGEDEKTQIVFALDGVEKGSEVEWLISYKKSPVLFGSETFQYGIPVLRATFQLVCPSRLGFEEKGYRGFPTVHDTLMGNMRYITASLDNVPALHEEVYSYYDINRMYASYKLSYEPEKKDGVRIFTWQNMVEKFYTNNYTLSDKEERAVDNYLETIGVKEVDPEEEKIKKIENATKANITVYQVDLDDEALKLNNVIAKKTATEGSLVHLFAACFLRAGIKHELGVTTNRNSYEFDPEFEVWNVLEKYVFFFPATKKYLSPLSTYIRYPFTDPDVISSKGAFCKMTTLGGQTRALADIRTINPMPTSESQNNINADIRFSPDMEAKIDVTYSFTGYTAMNIREALVLLPKEKQKELIHNIVTLASKPDDILTYSFSGEHFENYNTNKPLLIQATVNAPQFTEKAGPKYLFKLGDIIGKQVELYQASERKQPVDLDYPHFLNRTITLNLPDGYTVLNPETINLKTEFPDQQGTVTCAFTSSYKLEGNKLVVSIVEFYGRLHYPVSDFEPFRKVINASADFNKVTLLLGKK